MPVISPAIVTQSFSYLFYVSGDSPYILKRMRVCEGFFAALSMTGPGPVMLSAAKNPKSGAVIRNIQEQTSYPLASAPGTSIFNSAADSEDCISANCSQVCHQ